MKADCHFDAHCHLFNASFLLLELGAILRDALDEDYPLRGKDAGLSFPQDPKEYLPEILQWLKETAHSTLATESSNWNLLRQESARFWNDGLPIKAIPLMMDIYYTFSAPLLPGQKVLWQERRRDRIKNRILDFFSLKTPYFDSPGFHMHRRELEKLAQKQKGNLFPFFAIDPRRPGVIDAVRSGKIVSRQGPFYGVKLYPRLGYHPQCDPLWPLYEWCDSQQIPLIVHTDEIGFPPPFIEKLAHINQGELGNPAHWEAILDKHPNLIIDFAHFGMSNPAWSKQIAAFIGNERYSSVYSDLACYAVPEVLKTFRDQYWHLPRVAQRTLLGTDFDVLYLVTFAITLQQYYDNFRSVFSPAELEAMSSLAPQSFLALR